MAVVAMDRNRLIGSNGQLPWRMPADLKRFREVTTPWPVVMGRVTWESIGRPLPNRRNVVISRQPGFSADGAEVVESIEDALALCADSERTMIIGGADIYAAS
jgi:dihydrofolate reductase